MKLLSIELNNYRQYRGNQKIEFSQNDKKNFTIIQGANGAGKTNLLNAITWCLYGDEEHLPPKLQKMPIINETLFSELNDGSVAECKVKITLGEQSPDYMIERSFNVRKIGERMEKFKENHIINMRTSRGWVDGDYEFVINRHLLPKKIRDFFFFDGERLNDFFRNTNLVKDATEDVAQLDLLEQARSHLESSAYSIEGELKHVAPKTKEFLEKINGIKKAIDNFTVDKSGKEAELKKAKDELEEIKAELREHPVKLIAELQERRDNINRDVERINDELEQMREGHIDALVAKAPLAYGRDAISNAIKLLEKETKKGRLPPNIRDTFIKELLEKGECICGTDISSKDDIHRKNVMSYLNLVVPSKIADQADVGKYALRSLIKNIDEFNSESTEYGKRRKKLEAQLKKHAEELNEIKEKIGGPDIIEEVHSLELNRERLEDLIKITEGDIRLIDDKIENGNQSIDFYRNEATKEAKKEDKAKDITKRAEFCGKALRTLKEVKQEIIENIRKTIESKTKEYFLSLIWKKKTYSDVKIDEDYRISVISRLGSDCLGTLSAGERQVLALSFMASLYEISGFNMPVVIDTPLGRISDVPSENIAQCLPDYLKNTQVTMLVTEKEYSPIVREKLLKRVGREYLLDFDEDQGMTSVEPYDE